MLKPGMPLDPIVVYDSFLVSYHGPLPHLWLIGSPQVT